MIVALLIVIIAALLWPYETRYAIAMPFKAAWWLIKAPFKLAIWLLSGPKALLMLIWEELTGPRTKASAPWIDTPDEEVEPIYLKASDRQSLIDPKPSDRPSLIDHMDDKYLALGGYSARAYQPPSKDVLYGFLKFLGWTSAVIVVYAGFAGHL